MKKASLSHTVLIKHSLRSSSSFHYALLTFSALEYAWENSLISKHLLKQGGKLPYCHVLLQSAK